MIEFSLTEEQEALRATAAKLADEVYAPRILEWDREGTFLPAEERRRLGQMGLLGIALPEAYGGGGADLLDALLVVEEVAKRNQIAAFQIFEANTGPARVIDLFGTESQKARLLPPLIAGEETLAVSISEPDAGSAATDMTTSAVLDDDSYVLNGMKRWCSGGGHAEQYLVYVRLGDQLGSKGIGGIVVDRETPGLTFGPQERLMGFHGIPSADMFFDDVRVPAGNLIVGEGGFRDLFTAFSIERLGNSTMALAIGQACLDLTAAYVQEREQFGRPIIEFQTVQAALADMIMQVEAARLLIWKAAAEAGRGAPDPLAASIAKCTANEMAKRVSDLAMQLHGGYGYHPEYHVERMHRDAHGWAMGGGTPTIQRIRIVSQYLGRSFDQRGA
ncbi:acyl-CoA dehydrogenase family protein [Euzebya tangerina]|uniref:acyl-CoA dehydrogenase family protein n=1 Tax=Euzebya tangerina TaxID=591198 RepID=UPI000E316E74|nr:acyl-CoA dehydrogenase family protein [Euzebya tangerina]